MANGTRGLELSRGAATVVTGLVALALTAALVVRTSTAAFTASTDNPGNELGAGTISLTDDDSDTVLLDLENLAPGEASSECITVEYTGSLNPEVVRVYSTSDFTTTPGRDAAARAMQTEVRITIEEGASASGGSFGDCRGFVPGVVIVDRLFLDSFDSGAEDYTTGRGAWDPEQSGERRVYRVTLEVDLDTDDTFQAAALSGISLTWETQSAPERELVGE